MAITAIKAAVLDAPGILSPGGGKCGNVAKKSLISNIGTDFKIACSSKAWLLVVVLTCKSRWVESHIPWKLYASNDYDRSGCHWQVSMLVGHLLLQWPSSDHKSLLVKAAIEGNLQGLGHVAEVEAGAIGAKAGVVGGQVQEPASINEALEAGQAGGPGDASGRHHDVLHVLRIVEGPDGPSAVARHQHICGCRHGVIPEQGLDGRPRNPLALEMELGCHTVCKPCRASGKCKLLEQIHAPTIDSPDVHEVVSNSASRFWAMLLHCTAKMWGQLGD